MKRKTIERPARLRSGFRPGSSSSWVSALASCLLGTATVSAQDLEDDRFRVRGFGTFGVTTHDAEGIVYRRNVGQARGATADGLTSEVESIAGAQFDVKLSRDFAIVVQGVVRQRSDGEWTPRLSQGFLRYRPDETFVARLGRIGYDIYLLAESRQVGYSYLPVRPSGEFYGQITNDDIDGGDVMYTRRLGPGLVRARVFGGHSDGEIAFHDFHSKSEQIVYGGTLDYIYRGWTWRAAVVDFSYDAGDDIATLIAGLRATGFPSAAAVADDLDQESHHSNGLQLGMAYDDGPMLAQIMYGVVRSDSISGPDFNKIYGLFGYRIRNWTPFMSHVRSEDDSPIHDAGLPPIPQLAPLNTAVVQIQQATRSTQYTSTAGVRYDLSSHIAFKLQLDHTHVRETALYFDLRPDAGTPYDMTVLAASVDFVF